MSELTTLADGLAFPEGPRWHDGRLWFSDQHAHVVMSVGLDGDLRTEAKVPNQPSGLGWLPDGSLLVVSMTDRRLLRLAPGGPVDGLVEVADLSPFATWHCNDMVVDREGRAYVGNFGYDMYGGAARTSAAIVLATPDGKVSLAADGLEFPNGMVITPDGTTLIVGESWGARLTAFTVHADGTLGDRRVFAALTDCVPDGICLDAEGAVWLASPLSNEVVRVRPGGEVAHRISTGKLNAFACMLGGDDRRTLFVCTAATHIPEEAAVQRSGRIEMVEVPVAGAGWP
jgi:sugar lactone lactonase YvrE